MFDLEEAMREWQYEVEAEAARLIRQGVPPWPAMEKAVRNISQRRRDTARPGAEKE